MSAKGKDLAVPMPLRTASLGSQRSFNASPEVEKTPEGRFGEEIQRIRVKASESQGNLLSNHGSTRSTQPAMSCRDSPRFWAMPEGVKVTNVTDEDEEPPFEDSVIEDEAANFIEMQRPSAPKPSHGSARMSPRKVLGGSHRAVRNQQSPMANPTRV